MNHVAKELNKTPDKIREINFYKKGQVKSINMVEIRYFSFLKTGS